MDQKVKSYDHNTSIVFVDSLGTPHAALVTAWWGVKNAQTPEGDVFGSVVHEYVSEQGEPGCNLVYIAGDKAKTDPYGRQLERMTSVVHKSKQPAHGMYWCWSDEVEF